MEFWQLTTGAETRKDGDGTCSRGSKRSRYGLDLNFGGGSCYTNSCENSRGADVESSTLSQCSSKGSLHSVLPSPAFPRSQSASPAVSELQSWINCNYNERAPAQRLQEQDLIRRLDECSDANSVDCTLSLGIGPPSNRFAEQPAEPATPVSSPAYGKIPFPAAATVADELGDSKREGHTNSSSRFNLNVDRQTNSASKFSYRLLMPPHVTGSAYTSARMAAQENSELEEQSRLNRMAFGSSKTAPFISAHEFPYNNYMGRTLIGESSHNGSGMIRPLYKWNAAAAAPGNAASTANNNVPYFPVLDYCRSENSMDAKEIQLLKNHLSLRLHHHNNSNNTTTNNSNNNNIVCNRVQVQKIHGRNNNIDSQNAVTNERKCSACETTTTPLWRNGPKGAKSLCNACGIRYKKEERRAAASAMTAAAPAGGCENQHLPFSQRDHHQITKPSCSNGLDAVAVDHPFNLHSSKKLKLQTSRFVSCTASMAS